MSNCPRCHVPGLPLVPVRLPTSPKFLDFRDNGDVWIEAYEDEVIPLFTFVVHTADGCIVHTDSVQDCYEVTPGAAGKKKLTAKFSKEIFRSRGTFYIDAVAVNGQIYKRWWITERYRR